MGTDHWMEISDASGARVMSALYVPEDSGYDDAVNRLVATNDPALWRAVEIIIAYQLTYAGVRIPPGVMGDITQDFSEWQP